MRQYQVEMRVPVMRKVSVEVAVSGDQIAAELEARVQLEAGNVYLGGDAQLRDQPVEVESVREFIFLDPSQAHDPEDCYRGFEPDPEGEAEAEVPA